MEEVVGLAEAPVPVGDLVDVSDRVLEFGDRIDGRRDEFHMDERPEASFDRLGVDDGPATTDHAGLTFLTFAAILFAVPQLLPQFVRIRSTGRANGVSLSLAALTAVSNVAWFGYFAVSGLWSGTVSVGTSFVVSSAICAALVAFGASMALSALIAGAWAAALVGAFALGGVDALGGLLAIAFAIQVVPSLWVAWTSERRDGISRTTWYLVAGEVVCWGTVGVLEERVPLIVLGVIGIVSSAAVLTLSMRPAKHVTPPSVERVPSVDSVDGRFVDPSVQPV